MNRPYMKRPWPTRPDWITPGLVRWTRWVCLAAWAVALVIKYRHDGLPYLRSDLLLWIALGLIAWSIGKRALWTVVLDFVPFAAVLIVYDHLRGVADTLGMPTWWHPQLDVDKALFGGRVPTLWLQEHLSYYPDVRWWDVVTGLAYISFFFLPYVTAAVLWLRSRAEFRRWASRFVTLSFLGFGFFALIPAAPPWAAARCRAVDVASHPSAPYCINRGSALADGGLLGPIGHSRTESASVVHRLSTRGLGELHLHFASAVIRVGQVSADQVAAVPSLHAGGTILFAIFIWNRVNVAWKAVLVVYNVLMAFALVYSAEHYVSDILAGWLAAAAVSIVFTKLEQRRKRATRADTLGPPAPTASRMESPECPPIATMPSSI
jgi:membrane-associated phospholipid phosphatase